MTVQGATPDRMAERRQWLRFDLAWPTSLTAETEGRSYDCCITDISLGGLRLRFKDEPPQARELVLCHHTAGRLFGTAVWHDASEMGLAFARPERDLEHLLQCISLILNSDRRRDAKA